MAMAPAWNPWIIPQDASGDLKLCPITSKLCNFCSAVCIAMAAYAHLFYEYADLRPAPFGEDRWMQWFLQLTATLALGGLIYEGFLAIAIYVMGLNSMYQEDLTCRRRLRLNRKMIFVFSFLTTVYHLMASDIQWVHKGWIAEYHGGHQIVFSVRYIEWVCCAPIVLSISGQLDHAQDGSPRNGMIPSALLTGIYCIISWQGIVVKDFYAAWALIFWAFVSYFVASVEQLSFAWYIKDKGSSGPLRAGLIVYLVVMIGIYGVIYLLPIPGWISATFENKFYCVGDISFKLMTSIMLLSSNDLAHKEEMRRRAETVADELQSLIHTAAVPIMGVDEAGEVNEWNMKAAQLTGLPADLAMGKKLIRMLGTGSQAEADAVIRQALEGVEGGKLETTLNPMQLDGWDRNGLSLNKATLVLSTTPRRDKAGTVKGVTLVGYDLTEVTAYKEAESRKVNFMAIVSHELRSPLHGIIGLMDHLSDDEEDPGKLRFFKMVSSCANRLLDLVVNIMEMASLVSTTDAKGKPRPAKHLSRDPVELSKIMDEIVVLVKSSTDKGGNPLVKKGVELSSEVKDMPIIEADAHKCTQVFYNIVTNACKFTMTGKITVTSRVDPEGQWVEVSVTDTGKGICRGSLERIFQPFEQEDNSMIRGYQGIGLGLSIAHEVVQRHGGNISVESEVDVGTTFTVRLPVVMAECTPAMVSEEESAAPTSPRPLYKSEESAPSCSPRAGEEPARPRMPGPEQKPRILSVDDDSTNQEVIKRTLGPKYEVDLAMDGQEALDYLESCERLPDVMLLDVMMPGLSGFQVCRHIREEMRIPPTRMPILMLSASNQDESICNGLESGANDYVTKPFHKQVLNAHVKSSLRIQQQFRMELERAFLASGRPGLDSRPGEAEKYDSEGGVRRRRA